jgi:hypothetical protein
MKTYTAGGAGADMADALQSLRIEESAGPVAVLREAVRLLPGMPVALSLFLFAGLVTLVSTSFGNLFAIVPQAVGVSEAYRELGGQRRGTNSFGVRLLLAFVAALIAGVGILLGLVFLILPGIYLTVKLRLVLASVVLEDCGPVEALGRSYDLVTGHGVTVFGVWLVPTLVSLVVAVAVTVGTGAVSLSGGVDLTTLEWAARIAGALSTVLVSPVIAAADAVMYGLYGPDSPESTGREVAPAGTTPGAR